MKQLIILLVLFISSYAVSSAQTLAKVSKPNTQVLPDGNYQEIKINTTKEVAFTVTGKMYVDTKGNQYPVYKTGKGRLFINKTSAKTGKSYKKYLNL